MKKVLNTTEAIGGELDELYHQLETGDMDEDDGRTLTMRLRILQQRADLIKNHALEAKLDQLEKLVEARIPAHLRSVA